MRLEELREEIDVEVEAIEKVIGELSELRRDVENREPTVREKTAAGAFLAQFYSGIENILKRICRFHSIPMPTGETWHTDLFEFFCTPSKHPLPSLFDESLPSLLAPYRKFRHVVYHGYGFQMDWNRMLKGVMRVETVFERFKSNLFNYLRTLER